MTEDEHVVFLEYNKSCLIFTSCMNFLQTGRISLLNVALNIITYLSYGVFLKIS